MRRYGLPDTRRESNFIGSFYSSNADSTPETIHILDKESYLAGYNSNLARVAAVEQQLIAQGKPINEETLTQVIGFQDRHYVEDYLAGIKRYEFDEETKRIRPGK